MIYAMTYTNAYLYGDTIRQIHEFRYRGFIDRQSYDVPAWEGMEYDEFDNITAVHFAWKDRHGDVKGVTRLAPTDRPYMLEKLWPDMVETMPLPHSRKIWEGTRFCVDNSIEDAGLRRRIKEELVLAYLEFALANRIEGIVGVMPPGIWAAVFTRTGWKPEFLGPPKLIQTNGKADKIVAGMLPVSEAVLANVRTVTGIAQPVLAAIETHVQSKAA